MVKLTNMCKEYKINRSNIKEVFENFNLEINQGDMVAVVGKSGSGKSTLLNILSGLDTLSAGEYHFKGEMVAQNNRNLSAFRKNHIGIIVQNFALINEWTVFRNIALPLKYRNLSKAEIEKQVSNLASSFGIEKLLDQYPFVLSGGESQRVAICRAIISNPSILIADEPTASLDEENKNIVFQVLKDLNEKGMTVIIATHDKEIYEKCDYQIHISDLISISQANQSNTAKRVNQA